MFIIPVLKRHRQELLEFTFTLGYIADSRPARDTCESVSNKQTNKQQIKPQYLVSWSLLHDDSGLEPRPGGPFLTRLGLTLQARSRLYPAVLTHILPDAHQSLNALSPSAGK